MHNIRHYTGCLLGGAIGDALGAPVEFMSLTEIQSRYGAAGISGYVEYSDGTGAITDDTQMTLFTAEALQKAYERSVYKGIGGSEFNFLWWAYQHWLKTQGEVPAQEVPERSKLAEIHELHQRRAPGLTCLSALRGNEMGTTDRPLNNSKGCGGIMRVAPAGLIYYQSTRGAFQIGVTAAAMTHGHPSGYLSAGFFAGLIAELVRGNRLEQAITTCSDILKSFDGHEETLDAVERAVKLSETERLTPAVIESLGGAWVGEEALAISLFCSLKAENDFRRGVLAAVNHSGDSDSTGAITGNILGLIHGIDAIPAEWQEKLRMADVIRQEAQQTFEASKATTW